MDTYKIELMQENRLIGEIDGQFAALMVTLAGDTASEALRLAAVLASSTVVHSGHIALDLETCAGKPLTAFFSDADGDAARQLGEVVAPDMETWRARLLQSTVVGGETAYCPLVLDEKNRLYLCRYFQYETGLARSILSRVTRKKKEMDHTLLSRGLSRYFPGSPGSSETDWQKAAAAASLVSRFSVVSGGPGTGKTHTVTAILALYLEQEPSLSIALCAPTGKAAARLAQSIKKAKQGLDVPGDLLARIPEKAVTIHRLLGVKPASPYFRRNSKNLLPVDLVVVDEASMVSLPLMAKLVQAVPEQASIILLGDKDQLASVEAGAVLGDICRAEAAPLKDAIVELKKSYRFHRDSGLARVGRAVNRGDGEGALEILHRNRDGSIDLVDFSRSHHFVEMVAGVCTEKIEKIFLSGSLAQAFACFESFRILCAHRKGTTGVMGINTTVEAILHKKGLIDKSQAFYRGRPIIILSNDYGLKLFNGDVGMIWKDENGDLKAFFPDENQRFRSFSPARLPDHETVYAMTIHKSQGSEYDNIVLVLPEKESPILTREMIYTGITRAKTRAVVWMDPQVFKKGVKERVRRASGLADRLV